MAFDVMSVFVKIGADTEGLESGLSKAKGMVSGLGNVVGAGMKAVGTAVAGATAAVGAFGAAALGSYANYEQLVGGVDKLYGTASGKLQEYANKAFLTAGMSANSYMETATSFSAALINSLGGDVDKAADMTDVAMKAMSDNVNVFGSDMGSVQNAFQGFAKQNYTMLDNLKLGYGGTKEGMQQLIDDANEYRASIGETADLSIDSFADIVQAIQSVQEAQNIAGTTNKEAMKTIEGSATATKAAWQNVITAIGRGEGLSDALNGLTTAIFGTDSGTGLLNQVIPRIQTVMEGIGEFVGKAAPFITEKIPALVSSILPSMMDSGMKLLGALGRGLLDNLPVIIDVAKQIISMLGQGIIQALPSLLEGAIEIIRQLGSFLIESIPILIPAIVSLINEMVLMLVENAPALVDGAVALLTGLSTALIENLPTLIPAIIQLVTGVAVALIENLPVLVQAVIDINIALVQAIIDNLPIFVDACVQILMAIVNLLVQYGAQFLTEVGTTLSNIWNRAVSFGSEVVDFIVKSFKDFVDKTNSGMRDMFNKVVEWLSQLPAKMAYYAGYAVGSFMKFILELPSKVNEVFNNVMNKLIAFGTNFVNKAIETAKNFLDSMVNGIKNLPTNLSTIFTNVMTVVTTFASNLINKAIEAARGFVSNLVDGVSSLPDKFREIGSNIVQGIWNGISSGWQWLKDSVANLAQSLLQGAKDALGIASPSKKFAYVGRMVDEGFAKGLTDYAHLVEDAMDDVVRVPDVNGIVGDALIGGSQGNAGYTQVLNISSPVALTPYEIARQTRNATRDMVLAMSL